MEYKQYNAKFTSDQPEKGTQCPICENGYIEANNFTDKKGQKWYSVVCNTCNVKWLSKYPPKEKGEGAEIVKELDQGVLILGGIEQLKEGIKILNENIKKIIEKLNG